MDRLSAIRHAGLGLLLLAGCGGDDLTLPNEGQPARIAPIRGDRQNGTVGEALSDSLVVRVTDRFDDPVSGVEVEWSAEGGGSVSPVTSLTGGDGRAAAERVLGDQPGTYFTIARVAALSEPVTFTTTGVAARLVLTAQLPAIAVSGTPLEPQPALQLQDADGAPIAREGVVVTVQIASGGGSLSGGTSATSDPQGRVAFTDLAIRGSPGVRTLIFAADAFAPAVSPPIAIGVGSPASIEAVAGDQQSAAVNTAVAVRPAVVVRDAEGNPISGIPVTFKVTAGGGSLSGPTPVTGSDGIAAVGGWTLGPKVGDNSLEAEVSGQDLSGSPVEFSATGTPGPVSADESRVSASPSTIGASGGSSAATITVIALDQFENPIPGLTVTLSATGSGNAITQPAAPTDGDGETTGKLSATSPGDRVVTAVIDGVTISETATVTVTAGPPVASGSSATVPGGTAGSATVIEVRLKDAQGNDVAGAANAISGSVSGANTVGSLSASDQGGGRYTMSYTPRRTGTDQVQIRVSGNAIPGSPFASQVRPGPGDPSRTVADFTWQGSGFFSAPLRVVVFVRDSEGNLLDRGGDQVTVRVDGTSIPVTDHSDGSYEATSDPIGTFAPHTVDVRLNGTDIGGSPFCVERFSNDCP